MIAENDLQCLLKKVCSGVILTCIESVSSIYFDICLIICLNCSLRNVTDMAYAGVGKVDSLRNDELAVLCCDDTLIAYLTAHRSVEGCNVGNDRTALALRKSILKRLFACDGNDLTLAGNIRISCECSLYIRGKRIEDRIGIGKLCGEVLIISSLLLLLFHCSLEAFLIYRKTFLLGKLHSKLDGESECIVEVESLSAVDSTLGCLKDLLEFLHAVLERALESVDLLGKLTEDEVLILYKERIALGIYIDIDRSNLDDVLLLKAQRSGMSYRTADKSSENVTCSGIGRKELSGITDEHYARSRVICKDTHGSCKLLVGIVLNARSLLDISDNGSVKVDLIYIVKSVKESEDTLETPTRIYVLLGKRSKCSVLMLFVLHEYVITDLGILTAVASGTAVGTAGRYILYIEHLTVGTAGTVLEAPPVILGGKVEDILGLKA